MKLVILLLCMARYVYGVCMVDPINGHVSAGTNNTDNVFADTPPINAIRTDAGWTSNKADIKAMWNAHGYCGNANECGICSHGSVYYKRCGTCQVGNICFSDGDVLDCPVGSVRTSETTCSTTTKDMKAAFYEINAECSV